MKGFKQNFQVVPCFEHEGQILYGVAALSLMLRDHHVYLNNDAVNCSMRKIDFLNDNSRVNLRNLLHQNWYVLEVAGIRKVEIFEMYGKVPYSSLLLTWENFIYILLQIRKLIGENSKIAKT